MTSHAALRYFCELVTTYAVPSVPCGGMASTSYSTPFSETVIHGLMKLTAPQGHGGIVFPMDVFLIVSVGLPEEPWLDGTHEQARQNCPVLRILESPNLASIFYNEH